LYAGRKDTFLLLLLFLLALQKSRWCGKWAVRRFELLDTKQLRVFRGPKLRATFDLSGGQVRFNASVTDNQPRKNAWPFE
jgi:hypothetical protein